MTCLREITLDFMVRLRCIGLDWYNLVSSEFELRRTCYTFSRVRRAL